MDINALIDTLNTLRRQGTQSLDVVIMDWEGQHFDFVVREKPGHPKVIVLDIQDWRKE